MIGCSRDKPSTISGPSSFEPVDDDDNFIDRHGLRKDASERSLDEFGAIIERNDRCDRSVHQAEIPVRLSSSSGAIPLSEPASRDGELSSEVSCFRNLNSEPAMATVSSPICSC